MSFEQKYLKYKQKYQELKRQIGGGNAHKLETDNDMDEFVLTATPTINDITNKQVGGGNEEEYVLSDTPVEEMKGGAALSPASYTAPTPLAACPGQVNPLPNVMPPGLPNFPNMNVGQTQVPVGSNIKTFTQVNQAAPAVQAVPPAPVAAVQNKNLVNAVEVDNTTTELSEIQNTEDIEKLFSQYGGKHRDRESSSSSSSESDSEDLESSSSDFSSDSISDL
jgi:hypothetical protein